LQRRKYLIATAAVTLVIAATIGVIWLRSSPEANGPLRVDGGITLVGNADVGQATTFAMPQFENTGSRDLVLDSVRLINGKGSPNTLTVEQYLIGLPSRDNGGGMSRGEPDPNIEGPWSAVAGTVIKPRAQAMPNGYALITVAHLGVLGRAWTDGVEIRYHIGTTHYVARSDFRYVMCTPFTGRTLEQLHQCGIPGTGTAASN
jgi:hypothetical protein